MQEQNSLVTEQTFASPAPRWAAQVTLILSFAGLIGLGLIASRLGISWPTMRASFGMPLDAISIVLIAQLIGAVAVSAGSGRLTARLNIGVLLAWSCGITAVALLGTGLTPSWELLVALSLLTGIGAGMIEASLNTYAAMHFSLRSMNWLHACFGIGATLGLAIMTAVVASSFGWRVGFVIIGLIELLLAICFGVSQRYWQRPASADPRPSHRHDTRISETLRLPVMWLAIAIFALSSGMLASVGQWFYSILTEQRGVSVALAGSWISIMWASLTIGRIVFGFVVQHVAATQILRVCMAGIVLSAILFWLNLTPWLNFVSIVLLGFTMAPQFPLLTSATPQYVGQRHAANGVGLQVAAASLGGVLLTSLLGILAQSLGLGIIAPALVVAALLMVVFFELLARHIPRSAA